MQPHSVAVPQCWQDAHFSATHIVQCAARLCWAVSPSASWGVLSATERHASSHDMLALAIINCPQKPVHHLLQKGQAPSDLLTGCEYMKGDVLLPLAEEWRIVQRMIHPDNAGAAAS